MSFLNDVPSFASVTAMLVYACLTFRLIIFMHGTAHFSLGFAPIKCTFGLLQPSAFLPTFRQHFCFSCTRILFCLLFLRFSTVVITSGGPKISCIRN